MEEKKMTESQVLSAVTGKPIEKCQEMIDENKRLQEKTKELMMLVADSKDSKDMAAKICSVITMLLQPLPVHIRAGLLEMIASVSLTGLSDKAEEDLDKFKENVL